MELQQPTVIHRTGSPSPTPGEDPIMGRLRELGLVNDALKKSTYGDIERVCDHEMSPGKYYLMETLSIFPGVLCCCPFLAAGAVVDDGQLQMVRDAGQFKAYGAGYHFWFSAYISKMGDPVNMSTPVLQTGPWTMCNVSPGTLRMIEDTAGRRLFLVPGLHQWNNANIKLLPVEVKLNQDVIMASPFTIINVGDNEAVVVKNARENTIQALSKGIHILTDESSRYQYTLQLTDQAKGLRDLNHNNPIIKTTTADNILLEFEVNYTYRIVDPQLSATHIGDMMTTHQYVNRELMKEVARYIRTQYAGQLTPASTNIRPPGAPPTATAVPVHEDGQSSPPTVKVSKTPPVNSIRLTAEWCEDVNHRMMSVGVEIGQPGLFQLQISDQNARESMREVAVQQAKANARLVSAQAEADAAVIEAKGRHLASDIDARANATATSIKAHADAEAIKTLALAQQEAVSSCEDPTAKQLLVIEKTGSFVGNNTSWIVPNLQEIAESFFKNRP